MEASWVQPNSIQHSTGRQAPLTPTQNGSPAQDGEDEQEHTNAQDEATTSELKHDREADLVFRATDGEALQGAYQWS